MQVAAADSNASHFGDDIVRFSENKNQCIDNSNVIFTETGNGAVQGPTRDSLEHLVTSLYVRKARSFPLYEP